MAASTSRTSRRRAASRSSGGSARCSTSPSSTMSGAGAAGVAIVKILQAEGVNDVVVCDRTGILYPGRDRLDDSKRWVAKHTNEARLQGSLLDALAGADVFVGVSSADLLQPADLRAMNQDAI